jgi:hypothetical protein
LHAADPSTSLTAAEPVYEVSSSGLLTFSSMDKAIRVAITLVNPDDAVVETTVNFVDARGLVLKKVRGQMRDGQPLVAELSRRDVGDQANVLLRVQVIHKLPGVRDTPYPIVVTVQPISLDGFGRYLTAWPDGDCGCPLCGAPTGRGSHAYCPVNLPAAF